MNWPLKRRNGNGSPSNGLIIEMAGITKVYDTGKIKVEALRGIDLEVRKGEFVAVVGPSGSGKSTLLNLVGCLDTPSDGDYRLGGEAVAGLDRDQLADVRNRRVGFVFQNFNLLPQLTALENVEMPLMFGGVGGRERRRRALAQLEQVGLADRVEHRPTELSGGQMQRVAIARALAMEPDIILADEPTGNLDTGSADEVFALLREINRERGTAFLVVTHDRRMADRCDRIVELVDGRIVADSAGA